MVSDRDMLIKSEARELVRHLSAGGSKEYVSKRAQVVDKLYGAGARDKIRDLMAVIKREDYE